MARARNASRQKPKQDHSSRSSGKSAIKNLVDRIRQGDVRVAARTCSLIENEDPSGEEILSLLYRFGGNSVVVGVTGPPGAGKSTLLSGLVDEALSGGHNVGVIAIDPTSPITGGALLADRLRIAPAIRQQVFIRSLATRGALGGLSFAAFGILRILEAMGKDMIFVESVGAGQNEIAIANLATTTLYVTVPNLGDDIQALKAGILEVSDIFVVNKVDLGNSEAAVSQLRFALALKDGARGISQDQKAEWKHPILPASALQRKGIAQIFSSVKAHEQHLISAGDLAERRKRQIAAEFLSILERRFTAEARAKLNDKVLSALESKKIDPHSFARQFFFRKAK